MHRLSNARENPKVRRELLKRLRVLLKEADNLMKSDDF